MLPAAIHPLAAVAPTAPSLRRSPGRLPEAETMLDDSGGERDQWRRNVWHAPSLPRGSYLTP